MTRSTALLLCLGLSFAAPVQAQEDRPAGLFTTARQLPLVSQSIVIRVHGGEASIELSQVFANDGPELAQADFRLHLPREACVTGFGFWHEGRFLAAEMKEREQARRDHDAAAASGRSTAILHRERSIHSFSVFPVPAGALQQVDATISLPVTTERGRSHVRLPLDHFLGHAHVTTSVVAHLSTSEDLHDLGVDGLSVLKRRRSPTAAELAFTTDEPVTIWWATENPPLLARAEAVALDHGSTAIQLRLALNDASLSHHRAREIQVIIDESYSMLRRRQAVDTLLQRIREQSKAPVRTVLVGESAHEITGGSPADVLSAMTSSDADFRTTWGNLQAAADRAGCHDPEVRCLVVTDPQVDGLPSNRDLNVLFLADADELSHFAEVIGPEAATYQPDVDPAATLRALADEIVLPVLEVKSIRQGGDELTPVGSVRPRIAAGAMLRLCVESTSSRPLEVELEIDGDSRLHPVSIDHLDPDSRAGRSVRRAFFRNRLDDLVNEYRRLRDPEVKREIISISTRESIPTDFTSLHVAAPDRVLSRSATAAPLLRVVGLVLLLVAAATRWYPRW